MLLGISGYNQNAKNVSIKEEQPIINPMRLHEESLGSQKTNIIT
jgi:hypothetical protein